MPESLCPTCGSPVTVHASDEGTHSYVPGVDAHDLVLLTEWRAAEKELRAAVAAREDYWGTGKTARALIAAVRTCRVRVERARTALLAADDTP